MQIGMGVLVHRRPIHTALTLAYALAHKSEFTDLHVFYSIYSSTPPLSRTLHNMLVDLAKRYVVQVHYLYPSAQQNCGGNVDTLMYTMSNMLRYECFIKIDDDVLIGPATDQLMGKILLDLEKDGVYLLMGQAVRAHMRQTHPFCWEGSSQGHRVIQRSRMACPMETYTAVSMRFLNLLKKAGKSVTCDNDRGTFMPYARKVAEAGGRAGLVLSPCIQMQHIGLTSTIERGDPVRNWAPATSWDEPGKAIEVPYFNFETWEDSHRTGELKNYAVSVIQKLREGQLEQTRQALSIIIGHLNTYVPGGQDEVPLPPSAGAPARPVQIIRREDVNRVNGVVVNRPTLVKRVIVRHPAGTRQIVEPRVR